MFELMSLPYDKGALAPHISEETLNYHHGKHHQAYVNKLNELLAGTDQEGQTLEAIIQNSTGVLFNQAAQVWNHDFYWQSLSPQGGGTPTGKIADAINASFGDFETFKTQFTTQALGLFGSAWLWLIQQPNGNLILEGSSNAQTPIAEGARVILTCDVWEHAYYVDYRNARPEYLKAYWSLVNWSFANQNLA